MWPSFHHLGIDSTAAALRDWEASSAGVGRRDLRLPPEQPLEVSRVADPRVRLEAPHGAVRCIVPRSQISTCSPLTTTSTFSRTWR